MRELYQFHGGIHPPSNKTQSTRVAIAHAPLPSMLTIPFHQHAGETAKPVVKVGDHVLKGQLIGLPDGFVSSAVHASTSGTIAAIDMQLIAHPSGLPNLCATLIPDGKDEWIALEPVADYRSHSTTELQQLLRMAGVVGLGGAAFPSDIKLRIGKQKINTLILNGAECEPYITCDDMLMRERAAEIVQGAEILRFMLDANEVLYGVEDNKPEAIAALQQAIAASKLNHEVVSIPTIYPGGSAKQLIRVLTGLEVPSGKLPTDIGVQCFNVATACTAHRAIAHGEPLLSRVVTITGNVRHAKNYEVLIGTPINELVALSEALPDTDRYIMGGPMMGVPLPGVQVPVVKATNCVIAASAKLFPPLSPAMPCIRCTRCAEVCPADLQPQDLYWFAQSREFGRAQAFSLFDCIECGACSYVCPSHIPLVQYYRFAKSEIRAREHDKQLADQARERHEYREHRIEREKREKAEKLAAKAKAAKPAEPLTSQQQAEQAELEARREHIREVAQSAVEHTTERNGD
ncbi:MAG: electron transport complex subunit RsxC [Nitrosomonadales bacterium]|nr:electron transport complex subunit RsxC [Nitrosomonadales bacterium]